MEYTIIDTILAQHLEPHDFVRVRGHVGRVLTIEENPRDDDWLIIRLNDEDEFFDVTEIQVLWDEDIELLDYDYSGIEV